MTQEDKNLLLKDLCARLPYGVKGQYLNSNDPLLKAVTISYGSLSKSDGMVMDGSLVPWLFPLSSMTDEQKEELDKYLDMDSKSLIDGYKNGLKCAHPYFNVQDWYNKNHFDYRGLIPMGLAIDATGKNIY